MGIPIKILGILFFIGHLMPAAYTNGPGPQNEVVSCKVRGRAGSDTSLTLNVTYEGPHRRTEIKFQNKIHNYTNITDPCQASATNLSSFSCTRVTSTFLYIEYEATTVTNTNITISKFNFNNEGQEFRSGVIVLRAEINDLWSEWTSCDYFHVPPLQSYDFTNNIIRNIGTKEIEKSSTYSFNLFFDTCLTNPILIYIVCPYSLRCLGCSIPGGTCSTRGLGIVTLNYTEDACDELQFELNTINPNSTLLYSDIKFNIWGMDDLGMDLRGAIIYLYSESASTRYTPHPFAPSAQVVGANSSTIKITEYTFNFIAQDYQIYGLKLKIVLPSGMIFTQNQPRVDVLSGFTSSFNISVSNNNQLVIEGGFDGMPAVSSSNIQFTVDYIQNPYEISTSPKVFRVYIYEDTSDEPYFRDNSEFSVIINTISEFSSFQVTPADYRTNIETFYFIRFQLGDGSFYRNDYIKFTYPSDIRDCRTNTTNIIEQGNCSTFIGNQYKFESKSQRMFGYRSYQCSSSNGTIIELSVLCCSPETTKPTGNFGIQIQSDNETEGSIYYYSMGSPVQMTKGTFQDFNYTMLNTWLGYSNAFSFYIKKISPYDSSDIDQVSIIIPSQLSIVSCPNIIYLERGMTPTAGGFEITCSAQIVIINSIASLSQIFEFTLNNIQNPSLAISPISFTVETSNSEGFDGESGISDDQYAICAYPCYTCTPSLTTNCTDCYSQDNPVFEGGISLHVHYISESLGICLNTCPPRTYQYSSGASCADCHTTCEECSITATNCTKCLGSFLHNYECLLFCPAGYSDNVDEWTCIEIKSFEAGSSIQVLGGEVEILTNYTFKLYPEERLKFTDSKLEITSPPSIDVGNSCESTLGICSISGSLITLTNILTADYDYIAGGAPIIAIIYNTYINPRVSYLLSETLFSIKTKINATIYHSIILTVSDPMITRYIPHILGGTNPLSFTSSTTVTLSTLSFNISNIEYPIPIGHKIIFTFPNSDIWLFNSGLNLPTYTPMESLNIGTLTIITPSTIIIEGIFTTGVVPPDSDIRFSINNILNPYALGVTNNIILDITNGTVDEKQFTLTTGLMVDIINIAEYSAFSVTPNNYITSAPSTYKFSITLGDGGMGIGDQIYIKIPSTVTDCDCNTIIATQGFSSPIINPNYESNSDKYYFNMPCDVPGETELKFEMDCNNPETTHDTDDFLIQSAIIATEDIFYEISGSSVIMNILNTFDSVAITISDNRPLVNNTITLTVTRTANYPSTHIDRIVILFPNSMNISSADYRLGSGISGTIKFNREIHEIIIRGITQLLHIFTLDLLFIQNPPLSADDIQLMVMTSNSVGGFQGERTYTNILHTICDFPCQTCEISNVINCESCFPELDPAHPIDTPQAYFLVPNLKQCLDECPLTYYENETAVCDLCDPSSCKHCDISSTNCTSCYPEKFLHMNSCIAPCLPHYYQNDIDWLCEPCHATCANCSSTLETGCTLCYVENEDYLFMDGHCGDCPSKTFFDATLKDCVDCDFRCGECTGPSNAQCTICSTAIAIVPSLTGIYCECQMGYFTDHVSGICHPCHSDCGSCQGVTDHDCLDCRYDTMDYDSTTFTCTCPADHYKGSNSLCLKCDVCCKKCIGPGHTLCQANECNKENSCYPLESPITQPTILDSTTCLYMCKHSIPLFLDTSSPGQEICRKCHPDCNYCYGDMDNTCLGCIQPYLLTDERECIYRDCTNYPNTFPTLTKCEKCNEQCDGCERSPSYCINCASPYLFFKETHSCLSTCPDQFYDNHQISLCQKCPVHCKHCKRIEHIPPRSPSDPSPDNFHCLFCLSNYFLNSESICVSGGECGAGTYPDIKSKICERCNTACDGCVGPLISDCLVCAQKYLLNGRSICEERVCQSDEYIEDKTFICKKCNPRCEGCSGPSESECKSCSPRYIMNSTALQCQTCEEYDIAYLNPHSGNIDCLEVCGDKKNMGIFECDDGNKLSGDGCSSDCLIEDNFKCEGGTYNTPDTCLETVPPLLASFSLLNHEEIEIHFTELVKFKVNDPMKALQIFLTGPALEYIFQIKQVLLTEETNSLLHLKLNVTFFCTLYGSEKMTISINNTKLITDLSGNEIKNISIPLKLKPYEYITDEEKSIADGVSSSSQLVIISTLLTALLLCLVFNTPLEGLWGLINVLQLISYTMLLHLKYPKNLLIFLEALSLVHGFNTYVPNIFKFLLFEENNRDQPYNETFEQRGFDTRTMLILVGSEISLFVFIFMAIAILILVKRMFKKLRFIINNFILKRLRYSILIRSLITGYLKIVLAAFINFAIVQISYQNYESVYTSLFCIFFTGFVLLFPAHLSLFVFENYEKALSSEEFKDKYDSLIKEFAIEKGIMQINFYPLFLLRRSIFGAILVFAYEYPLAQLILIEFSTICMISWMIVSFPFKDKLICFSHIISEFGFLLYSSALFPFLSESIATNPRSYLGSLIIWGLIGLIILIWIIFLIHIVKVCIFNRKLKKDEAIAQELEMEEKEKAEKARALIARRTIYRKRKSKSAEMATQQKEKKKMSIMQVPICADTLISRPNPNSKLHANRKPENRFISPYNTNTKTEDKEMLMTMIQLKPNETLTAAKYNDNNQLMREFNEKWRNPSNFNKTLHHALLELYVEQNLQPDEDQSSESENPAE